MLVLVFAMVYTMGQRNETDTLDTKALQEMADTIQHQYYFYDDKEIDNEKLKDAAMRGMISKLDDPYAQYYTEEEYQQLLSDNAGDYVGIGISIQAPDETGALVLSVYSGAPAELAGIQRESDRREEPIGGRYVFF